MSTKTISGRSMLRERARHKKSVCSRVGIVALYALTILWATRGFTTTVRDAKDDCGVSAADDSATPDAKAAAPSKPGNGISDDVGTASDGNSASTPGGTAKKAKRDLQQDGAAKTAKDIITSIGGKLPSPDIASEALNVINTLLKTNRADQKSIYMFVRLLNRNIRCIKDDPEYVASIKKTTSLLLKLSYSDQLFQNGNLSNQIQTRLPLIIADSVKLTVPSLSTPPLRKDFREDLELLAGRIETAKRFRVGIGVGYSYLPQLRYRAAPHVDFTPFQLATTGGADLVVFNADFSNRSMAELVLSARVPFAQIDVGIPDRTQTETITTTVQERPSTATADLLARTTINSKVAIIYDVTASLSLNEIYEKVMKVDGASDRLFVGLGGGMTGFQITDSISTDVRIRTDPTKIFNDLPNSGTVTSSNKTAFNSTYVSAHARYHVSDELEVGLAMRKYVQSRSGSAVVDISGLSVALSVVWFPTFPW
jgi:hypothetical protein